MAVTSALQKYATILEDLTFGLKCTYDYKYALK